MRLVSYTILGVGASTVALNAAQQSLTLHTSDATGTLYVSNFNTESVEPNTAQQGSKPFNYPYYFDPVQSLWVVIVAEPLSASNVYPYEQANYTVLNTGITDTNSSNFSFGELTWDDSLLTGVGAETIGIGDFTFTLDATRFSPNQGPNNIDNEANWAYNFYATNLTGTGLSFVDGVLTSVDFDADLTVETLAFGTFPLADTFGGTVAMSGNEFIFAVDETKDINTPLGPASNVHTFFDTAGTFDLVPEPRTYALALGIVVLALAWGRRRFA